MMPQPHKHATAQPRYWKRTRRLTVLLLLCWLSMTFGVVFFARELSGFTLFGWPFSYYMVAQGTTLLYLLIVGLYAWRMQHLDRRFRQEAGPCTGHATGAAGSAAERDDGR